jgi:phage gpG-like protein
MGSDFEVTGLEEWQEKLLRHVSSELPAERDNELMKLGFIAEREIKKQITDDDVVDIGRLRASITTQKETDTSVLVGTNVDYAIAVNNGHIQHKRFLPAKYLTSVKGRTYLGEGNTEGIMLKEKFIAGRHFMEKGVQRADPLIQAELTRWFNNLLGKLGE